MQALFAANQCITGIAAASITRIVERLHAWAAVTTNYQIQSERQQKIAEAGGGVITITSPFTEGQYMAIEDRIECQGCGRPVVPQLWVDDRDWLMHTRVIHLCPFCGTVLRQTGGQPNRRELAFILGFVGLGVLMLILMLLKAV